MNAGDGTTAYCNFCGRYEHFSRVRLMSKVAGTWKCQTCHNKEQCLRRIFGKWPTGSFQNAAQEMRHSFMARIAEMSTVQITELCEQEEITTIEEDVDFFEEGGEFLPLSVWEQRGYDITIIEDTLANALC